MPEAAIYNLRAGTVCASILQALPLRNCQEVYSKRGPRQLTSDECVFVRYANNIKGAPDLTADDLLERGAFETMETVPPEQRIYPSCPHPVAIMILAMYVDNNGIRHNCDELVEEFEAKVKQDGRIKLNREGGMEWFLGVRYSFNSETGEVTADQEAYIDSLGQARLDRLQSDQGAYATKRRSLSSSSAS